jgi:NTE family protein
MNSNKKIGLTLSGGGAKGFAHIGVYEVLHKNKVPIHALAGSSIGAFVAAGIAQGKTPQDIYQVMRKLIKKKKHLIGLSSLGWTKGSLLDGKLERGVMEELIPKDLEFKDLKIPLVVNAVDLENGEEVVFKEGNVFQAVLASSALPGLYPPVYYKDRLFVDGGILNYLPVNHCKAMGIDFQIAVDLQSFSSEQNISGLIYEFYIKDKQEEKYDLKFKHSLWKEALLKLGFPVNVMLRSLSIASDKNAAKILKETNPAVLIRPDVSSFSVVDIEDHQRIYMAGLREGEEAMELINSLTE